MWPWKYWLKNIPKEQEISPFSTELFQKSQQYLLTLWPPGQLLTALSIFPRSAFDGFYLKMSLSHGYLLRIRINQVREVSIVYCQWIVIAYGIPFHWKLFCKSGFKFSLEDFVISFKNGVLLGWLESRNCTKKNYLPYLIPFGVILQRTYVATFLSLHIWT